ncbi:M14 family metallopeptidase [Clostridium formicaceticum]|uniref:Succinylglutamate desuccinylase n=1 Tax=Clostridium formicaceticum TaxID=1497 RepID=A0AAC9RNJ5_9CLOT|nr:M14 family metallopeptidase [Clostridium formicaceticum]AOY74489.1 succinylglutamate desuccinylase [Clostridium formicaceticum]ARE88837.1 Succinylglutamate desuccinylase / Aspartoacylase family protein [Clostridium formicaceticum]
MALLKVGNLSTEKGIKVQGFVTVMDTDTVIPVTLINGCEEGKTVLITGGVHSCEYAGIQTAIELAKEVQPEDIKGRLMICHPLNKNGFEARRPSIVPEDGKNLNRVFPGNKSGTLADKIAYMQVNEFQNQADFYIDMHGGEAHEQLTPYVYYVGNSTEEAVEIARNAASVMDCKYMVRSMATTGAYNYCGLQGTPSILMERGCSGIWDQETVDLYKKDVYNILIHLGLIKGPMTEVQNKPKDLVDLIYLNSDVAGCWYPSVDAGDEVKEGQKLGEIRDYFSNLLATYYAEYDGVILYRTSALWVDKDGGIVCYGKPE